MESLHDVKLRWFGTIVADKRSIALLAIAITLKKKKRVGLEMI